MEMLNQALNQVKTQAEGPNVASKAKMLKEILRNRALKINSNLA